MLKVHYKWSVQLKITQTLVLQSDCKKQVIGKSKEGAPSPRAPPTLLNPPLLFYTLEKKCITRTIELLLRLPHAPSQCTLQFQIIIPPLINFWIFCRAPFLIWSLPLLIFKIFFANISEIVKTDRSICETVEQEEQKDEYRNSFDFLNNFSVDMAKICY